VQLPVVDAGRHGTRPADGAGGDLDRRHHRPVGSDVGRGGPFKKLMDVWADMINENGGLHVRPIAKKFR
jgi:hypothetical protein